MPSRRMQGLRANRHRWIAAAAWCGVASAAPAWSADLLKPCRVAGLRNQVQCGVVQRALDPARLDAARIDIHYVVVPAMARRTTPH